MYLNICIMNLEKYKILQLFNSMLWKIIKRYFYKSKSYIHVLWKIWTHYILNFNKHCFKYWTMHFIKLHFINYQYLSIPFNTFDYLSLPFIIINIMISVKLFSFLNKYHKNIYFKNINFKKCLLRSIEMILWSKAMKNLF